MLVDGSEVSLGAADALCDGSGGASEADAVDEGSARIMGWEDGAAVGSLPALPLPPVPALGPSPCPYDPASSAAHTSAASTLRRIMS